MKNERFLTRKEVAEIFSVTPQAISNWIEKGIISASKINGTLYVSESSVDILLSKFVNISSVENRLLQYKEDIYKLEFECHQKISELEAEIKFYDLIIGNKKVINSIFINAYSILSKKQNKKTIEIVEDFFNGSRIGDIANKYDFTTERIRQIINKSLNRLSDSEKYISILNENKHLKSQVEILNGKLLLLEKEVKRYAQKEIIDYQISDELFNTKLEDLGLSVRSLNCLLYNARVQSLGQLIQLSKKEVLELRNLGKESFNEIDNMITSRGLHWGTVLNLKNL